jgi:hypothetical protein
MSYAEAARVSDVVRKQDRLIANKLPSALKYNELNFFNQIEHVCARYQSRT